MFENFLRTEYGYLPGPRLVSRAPTDWVDEPYTRFSIDPVAPTVGGVVQGADLSEPIDDDLYGELNRALLEWKVLLFRDQDITDEQQLQFAQHWGPIDEHPFYGAASNFGGPSAQVMTLEKGPKAGGSENFWHVGLDPEESARLFDLLYFQTTFPEYQCRWKWRTRDVA